MLEELWVDIDLLPNYAVSNYGNIVNVNTNRELKPRTDKNGYQTVALYRNGRRHTVYVHRLVAYAFFLNYEQGIEVKHVSENKSDNSVLNLTLGERACRQGDTLF